MAVLKYLFEPVFLLFSHDFTIFGFTFSFFDIFVAAIIFGIIGKCIFNIFDF